MSVSFAGKRCLARSLTAMDRYRNPSLTRPAKVLGASLAVLVVMAFAGSGVAAAHGTQNRAVVQEVVEGAKGQVFDAIRTIPTHDADTGLLDYGEMANGAELLSHG